MGASTSAVGRCDEMMIRLFQRRRGCPDEARDRAIEPSSDRAIKRFTRRPMVDRATDGRSSDRYVVGRYLPSIRIPRYSPRVGPTDFVSPWHLCLSSLSQLKGESNGVTSSWPTVKSLFTWRSSLSKPYVEFDDPLEPGSIHSGPSPLPRRFSLATPSPRDETH